MGETTSKLALVPNIRRTIFGLARYPWLVIGLLLINHFYIFEILVLLIRSNIHIWNILSATIILLLLLLD